MTVLSAQSLRKIRPLEPFLERAKHEESGCSYGLSMCGIDVRLDQTIVVSPWSFTLASTMEKFVMPPDIVGIVHDKSTWARRGLAVQNTVIEPGWVGFLTLEISCNIRPENWDQFFPEGPNMSGATRRDQKFALFAGTPIAQIIFHRLDEPTDQPYNGKYQHQERQPVPARFEK